MGVIVRGQGGNNSHAADPVRRIGTADSRLNIIKILPAAPLSCASVFAVFSFG